MSDREPEDTTPPTHQPYGHDPYNAPPPPPYGQDPYAAQQPPAQYPQPGQGYPAPVHVPPNHPSANTALVLGIVALAGGLLCGLPLLAGPFAWYTGRKVKHEIDANPQQYGGRSEASAGMVLGIVATVLLALGVLMMVAVMAIVVVGAGTST
ncbi:hypothetical protein I601_0744 [Nocardioides dokdonensis FR1436]|uniref:DUF4190 domain-containing protein n=1 Tax=Nocardioides dokdonensis FR1436 TaxID=1300347 RepID=A0A1A9GHW4_9ACTN|nr:hypothetical protein [Nocardioides dokdonensis]ANH37193.1 hypothetical protein I601_0744 [Nocardioides dokdonensis FR1436]